MVTFHLFLWVFLKYDKVYHMDRIHIIYKIYLTIYTHSYIISKMIKNYSFIWMDGWMDAEYEYYAYI